MKIAQRLMMMVFALYSMNVCAIHHPHNHEADTNYDYFLLVHMWPPTDCANGHVQYCPSTLYPYFTIHGLWAERYDGTWPQYCTNEKFEVSRIESIKNELEKLWPNMYGGYSSFWKHEYEKHGTCAEDVMENELSFFLTTLKLAQTYTITQPLLDAGLNFTSLHGYSVDEWKVPIKAAYGYEPIIWCSYHNGVYVVDQIALCISKSLNVTECSHVKEDKGCPLNGKIYWPAPTSVFSLSPQALIQ